MREAELLARRPLPRNRESSDRHLAFVEWVEALGNHAGAHASLSYEGNVDLDAAQRLSETLGERFEHLFWLTFEAVENAMLHSEAKNLRIELQSEDERVLLTVADNGEGIVRTSGSENPERGLGLRAIRNFAHLMDAKLELGRDANGYGLRIDLSWQVPRPVARRR